MWKFKNACTSCTYPMKASAHAPFRRTGSKIHPVPACTILYLINTEMRFLTMNSDYSINDH